MENLFKRKKKETKKKSNEKEREKRLAKARKEKAKKESGTVVKEKKVKKDNKLRIKGRKLKNKELDNNDFWDESTSTKKNKRKRKRKWWKKLISFFLVCGALGVFVVFAFCISFSKSIVNLSFSLSTGITKENVVPLFNSLSTQINPWCASINCLAIGRPKPVPPFLRFREFSICWNWSNTFCVSSGAIPIPLSATETFIYFSYNLTFSIPKSFDRLMSDL